MSSAASLDLSPVLDDSAIERRYEMFQTAVLDYDPASPAASHLRAHQVEALGAFCSTLAGLTVDEFATGTGISIVMPTGSGKTIIAGEIMRLAKAGAINYFRDEDVALRALLLTPRHSISNQTIGDGEEKGIKRFAPDLTVGRCKDILPSNPQDVNIGLYQGMAGLAKRGFLRKLDPMAIVCDEAHHVSEGKWSQQIEGLAPGRLLVGLTATPEYSPTKNIFDMFSKVAIRRSMRDGIEAGYLANLEGHLYRGTSRIKTRRTNGSDFSEEDVFQALIQSEDNYLAAKICAMEVAKNRKGILFAVPGYDRAHSKLMAKIISAMTIDTPTGSRKVVAEHVDGDISAKEFKQYNDAHREGEIDILTNVDLLLEGWDNPAAEFAFLMRPIESWVMAEQRIGRILRFVQDKIATVHELIYDFEGQRRFEQITHLDILDRETTVHGKSVKPNSRPQKQSQARKFDADNFDIDPKYLSMIDQLDTVPIDEIKISCGQKLVPYDWSSLHHLSIWFDREPEELEAILKEKGVLSRSETYESGAVHTYYPARARDILAESLDIPPAPDNYATLEDIYKLAQSSPLYRQLSRTALRRKLQKDGYKPRTCIAADGQLVHAYDEETAARFAPLKPDWRPRPKPQVVKKSATPQNGTSKPRKAKTYKTPQPKKSVAKPPKKEKGARKEIPDDPIELIPIIEWCDSVLVPVQSLPYQQQKRVTYAQDALASTLKLRSFTPTPSKFTKIVAELDTEVEISDQIRRLIEGTKSDLATVLFFAQRAKRLTDIAIEKGTL